MLHCQSRPLSNAILHRRTVILQVYATMVEISTFWDVRTTDFVKKCEKYFQTCKVDPAHQIILAYLFMEGEASHWFNSYIHAIKNLNWDTFVQDLQAKFVDPVGELEVYGVAVANNEILVPHEVLENLHNPCSLESDSEEELKNKCDADQEPREIPMHIQDIQECFPASISWDAHKVVRNPQEVHEEMLDCKSLTLSDE